MPNWYDGERRDTIKARCVDPITFENLGWLTITGATITEGYYTDTRIQGTVTALDAEQYVPLSAIRLIHEADFHNGEHYVQTLGTFFAVRSNDNWKNGAHLTEFELKSVLYGMSKDPAPYEMTLAEGSMTKAAFLDICDHCNRKKRQWVDGANNKKFTKNHVLALGDSRLSWLHQLADMTENRIDCDASGAVIMSKYTAPSKRTAKMSLAYNSTLVISSGIVRESNFMEVPMRAIVTWEHSYKTQVPDGTYKSSYTDSKGVTHTAGSAKYKEKTERKTIISWADVDAGNQAHINRRGYRIASWHSEEDLGESEATAQKKAKEYLSEESKPTVNWEVTTRWFEVHEGDILRWKPSDSEDYRKVLVSAAEKNLFNFTIKLTLKEV